MMKLSTILLYLKKIQKKIESRDTLLEFCWHQNLFIRFSNFHYIKKCMQDLRFDAWFLVLLTFLKCLKIVLIKMVTILMMWAKMTTPGLPKIKLFWNKVYEVIVSLNDVNIKVLLRDSNYIVNVVTWPKFGNSSMSKEEVLINSVSSGFDQTKRFFFEGLSCSKFNNLGLALDMAFIFCISVAKGLKPKVRNSCWLILAFVVVIVEKLVGGLFGLLPPILNKVKEQ